MDVGEDFKTFCDNLTIVDRSDISARYKTITKCLNIDFWNSFSDTEHSLLIGSYGRDTAIDVSDLDMIFILPKKNYDRFDHYLYNGQSALLQYVKNSIQMTYPGADISGDGQVVVVYFWDGMKFEVVPAFENEDGSFTYPDSNRGGSWKIINPIPEINAIAQRNLLSNGNLKRLCRMTRAWKKLWSVPIGGLLIDTLAYNFIENWDYREESYFYYDWMSLDFFLYLANQNLEKKYWLAVGSNESIRRKGIFEYKAQQCYKIAIEAIKYESKGMNWSARQTWRKIYGAAYPS